ncbi:MULTISPECIES: trimeric intracellular cation channel family protein [Aequorivita]|uniref:Trimeric intracellular cation channel family protein n=1 Tax=Aequorivita iocasae TaxID=2803865 RepID=A0ABX7DNZ5_9FLAO|nr:MULTISPECIES: trimeric intracellular cation channel family protein [Aequorivita]QQX75855.1 trimeric intracellular cation channel family protein [Aequorivita iocasae]UCA55316.1 trimeric intracellular cation channel family protein [Aequorivita sp. F7]
MNLILLIDILGTIAFAISGVLTALNKRLDPFGILIIAFVTAVGGGTLRDVLIDANVAWMRNLTFVYVIFCSTIFAVVFRKRLGYIRRSLFLFDTIGIALYTIVGVEKGIAAGFHPIICVALGTMTACFGGVLRDILCNEIPIIFRKEIYATACILGASAYFLLHFTPISEDFIVIISGSIVIIVRLFAVYFNLSLPSIYRKDELENR